MGGLGVGGWYNVRLQSALQTAEEQREAAEFQRHLAEQRLKEVEEERHKAHVSAKEARTQKDRAEASFRKRLEAIDDFLIRVDGQLAKQGAPGSVRLDFLSEALGLSTALLRENKDNPDARRQAGRLYMSIGDLWRPSDLTQAQSAYTSALDLQKKLAADFPKRPEYRNEWALTSAHYALLLQDLKRYADGVVAFDEAIRLEDELAAQHPDQPDYPQRSASYCSNRANLLEEWGKKGDAEKGYRDALKRQEDLVARWPQGVSYHMDLATTATSLASLLAESDPQAAIPHLERVLRAWRDVNRLRPQYARSLYEAYFDLAKLLTQCGQHAELTKQAAELRRDFPNNSNETYNAACLAAYAVDAVANDRKLAKDERLKLADTYAAQAVKLLDMAIHEGYRQRTHMERDPDLNPLRQRKDYQELVVNLEKRYPQAAPTPAREMSELQQEYTTAQAVYQQEQRRARTVAEKKKVEAKRPDQAEFFNRFLQLAEKHRESPTAVEALVLILEASAPAAGKQVSPAIGRLRERALAALQRDHLQKPELADVCKRLAEAPAPDCERLLRAVLGKHSQKDVRGLAGYALAMSLVRQAEQRRLRDPATADQLCDQAEKQLEQVAKEYAGVSYGRTTLGEVAKDKLYELRHLTVGRPAMDIEAEDLNGKKIKLSDYRGKVVVLDFWADWCGFCRRMYPHERNLVARMAGKPFALLGVNCDDEKATAVRAVAKEQLAWRSWWQGRGGERLTTLWQVDAFPTIFILDAKGVIRYKFQGYIDKELDEAVEKLLREHEARP
jgi:thiol-disulfide isomerase/thioredoxin/tetratricopeptide (TPR) repeat protein